ncbi:MAG: phosphodiesterase [Clostridiales bacterium]|nr:phosphodiesterase [Clostridiales bacterium]
MKWFIASDIHGSAFYCRIMLQQFISEQCDRILLLGDLLYHGPRNNLPEEYAPKKVIAMLSEYARDILCVRGNCEAEVDQMVLPFPVMADYALLETKEHLVFATHGHIFNESHIPPLHKGDILLHGHTHVPLCTEKEGIHILNPGSVSIPKGNSWHGYMTMEDGSFIWKDLQGNEKMQLHL